MDIVALLFGSNRAKPSEGLGGFDEREETDLGLHVANCARRYDDLRFELSGVRVLLWIVIVILVASNVITVQSIIGLLT